MISLFSSKEKPNNVMNLFVHTFAKEIKTAHKLFWEMGSRPDDNNINEMIDGMKERAYELKINIESIKWDIIKRDFSKSPDRGVIFCPFAIVGDEKNEFKGSD